MAALAAAAIALAGCGAYVLLLPGGGDGGAAPGDLGGGSLDGGLVDAAGPDLAKPVFYRFDFCWGGPPPNGMWTQCPNADIELVPDGTTRGSQSGTWKIYNNGMNLYFDVDGNSTIYWGTLKGSCFEGTMSNNLPLGPSGTFRACPL